MTRKYVVTLEDTLKGWQEDEDELERKYGAEPLDCGNCKIVQAAINTGIRTASRLVDGVLDKIRAEINGMYRVILKDTPKDDWAVKWNDCLDEVLEIVDKYRSESEEHNHMTADEFAELFTERDKG